MPQLYSEMRGAFPIAMDSCVKLMNLERFIKPSSRSDFAPEAGYKPEFHPLNFEWYFTPDCAKQLAQAFVGPRREIICLGTPTVGAALGAQSAPRTRLLDSNPAILRRFPLLRKVSSLHLSDVEQACEIGCPADVIIFDAPWYLDDVLLWAAIAMKLVKRSGVLAFSLFPPLVRPAAAAERQRVLELVSSIGDVEIAENALVYETPLFEREALRAARIETVGNWRRGDLVLVRVRRLAKGQVEQRRTADLQNSTWRTMVVSGQVVKMRVRRDGSGVKEPITSIETLPGFVYPTVSARDPLRDRVDLWTSRNRVASVGNFALVTAVLSQMQYGASIEEVMRDAWPTHPFWRTSRAIERMYALLGSST